MSTAAEREGGGGFSPDEHVPLLALRSSTPRVSARRDFASMREGFAVWRAHPPANAVDHENKVVYYNHEALLSWRSAASLSGSALCQPAVGWTMVGVLCTAAVSAVLVISLVPDARKLDTKRFIVFLTLLKLFISFMLGVYVQQSFKRWQSTLSEFEKYLISIKQMVFLFHSIKVSQDVLEEVQRRSIVASYILNTEIHSLQQMDRDRIACMRRTLDDLQAETLLEPEEHARLCEVLIWKHSTKSFGTLAVACTVWAWIGELISQAKLEGGRPIAPPMHVRVLGLCQECMGRMEELKMNVVTQMPHAYAQLLAGLVYLNSFLLALACGLTIGSSASEAHARHEQLQGAEGRPGYRGRLGEFYEALQTAGVQLVILLLEPALYVAFLNIGHMLCYPFGRGAHSLPTESFIRRLHVELLMLVDGRRWSRQRRARTELEAVRGAALAGPSASDLEADGEPALS